MRSLLISIFKKLDKASEEYVCSSPRAYDLRWPPACVKVDCLSGEFGRKVQSLSEMYESPSKSLHTSDSEPV